MRNLLGKAEKTVNVKFMGTETVKVRKLSVAQVKEFQEELDKMKGKEEDAASGLDIQRKAIRMAVVGAEDLTDEEMDSFPLDDLSQLVQRILELAGVRGQDTGNA